MVAGAFTDSRHATRLKNALAYVVDEVRVLRYVNEAGKGDHRHLGSRETAYAFTTPESLRSILPFVCAAM